MIEAAKSRFLAGRCGIARNRAATEARSNPRGMAGYSTTRGAMPTYYQPKESDMSDLCRCADEVRCDMRAEIKRLTFVEKNHLQGIAMLEARIAELEAHCAAYEELLGTRVSKLKALANSDGGNDSE